jgi:hypothetical protein
MNQRTVVNADSVAAMPWKVARGEDYGAPVDGVIAAAALAGFTREDFLKLAWAALDQGVTSADMRVAREAFGAIESLLPEIES